MPDFETFSLQPAALSAAWLILFSLGVCYVQRYMDVTDLPFNALIGIERAEANNALLRLPSDPRYLNHLGSVHASALLALAEASSGEFLLRHFGSSEGIVPVVRRLESKFRKPAHGSVTSSASATPEALARLTSDLASKGRSLILVAVELHDESGTMRSLQQWNGSFNAVPRMTQMLTNRWSRRAAGNGWNTTVDMA